GYGCIAPFHRNPYISHRVSCETTLLPASTCYWCYRTPALPGLPYNSRSPVPTENALSGYCHQATRNDFGKRFPKRNRPPSYNPARVSILLHADNRPP